MFKIYKCIVCCIAHIPLDILGFCFCNWVYCIFWGFCVWLYFWRCLLIALVYSLSCFTWSCRASSNNFDQYFGTVVFYCGRLFSCQEYPAGFFFFEICLFFNISHMLIYLLLFLCHEEYGCMEVLVEFYLFPGFSGVVDAPFEL